HGGGSVVQLRKHNKFEKFESHYISSGSDDNPPPLPEKKKKHVHEYMKLFGQVSEPNPNELLRHSVHQMHLVSAIESNFHEHDHEHDFFHTSYPAIIDGMSHVSIQPPALPPKTRRGTFVTHTRQSLPVASKPLPVTNIAINYTQQNSSVLDDNVCRKTMEEKDEPEEVIIKDQSLEIERQKELELKEEEVEDEEEEEGPLDLLDVREYLVLKKEGDEGPEVRGGPVDALIVHASKANKNGRERSVYESLVIKFIIRFLDILQVAKNSSFTAVLLSDMSGRFWYCGLAKPGDCYTYTSNPKRTILFL
ncbi:hypothetical protein OTU49_003937, partial [Cherax quadricarinatus]